MSLGEGALKLWPGCRAEVLADGPRSTPRSRIQTLSSCDLSIPPKLTISSSLYTVTPYNGLRDNANYPYPFKYSALCFAHFFMGSLMTAKLA